MAECELAMLSSHCLNRRIADPLTLERKVRAWKQARNTAQVTIDGQFTIVDARIKLKRLYPEPQHKLSVGNVLDCFAGVG